MHRMHGEVRDHYKHHGLQAGVILGAHPSLKMVGVFSPMSPLFSSAASSFFICQLFTKQVSRGP